MRNEAVTLADFLLARIAEDESDWRAVEARPVVQLLHGKPIAPRMIAECEAKRRIVEVHHPHDHGGDHGDAVFCDECQWDHGDDSPRIDNQPVENFGSNPCRTLAALALPYADHPDYDEAWRP